MYEPIALPLSGWVIPIDFFALPWLNKRVMLSSFRGLPVAFLSLLGSSSPVPLFYGLPGIVGGLLPAVPLTEPFFIPTALILVEIGKAVAYLEVIPIFPWFGLMPPLMLSSIYY